MGLFSWIDVELELRKQRERGAWPRGLVGVDAYPDALVLRIRKGVERGTIDGAFQAWFGMRYQPQMGIALDGVPEKRRYLPVEVEVTDEEPVQGRFRPSFRSAWLLPEESQGERLPITWPDSFPPGTPPIFVFHSFKGGVGRTLHLIALLEAFSVRHPDKRALVIDADLEAPGLTPLAEAAAPGGAGFSVLDFLALAHSEGTNAPEAMEIARYHLQASPLHLHAAGHPVKHFFLPAFKEPSETLRIEVRPEHLVQAPGSSWHLGELFAALGRAVEADLVLIDLRAGASELAGPLLFDPRLHRVLVSTAGRQSIEGSRLVLEQLAKLAPPPEREDTSDPIVLLTMLPRVYRQDPAQLDSIRERFWSAYPEGESEGEDEDLRVVPRLRIEETYFAEELLVIEDLEHAFELLGGTNIERKSLELVDDLLEASEVSTTADAVIPSNLDEQRRALAQHARRLEFAESGEGESFLVTAQIQALGERFARAVPIAAVLGAKGAGKTYTYLQIVRAKSWRDFLQAAQLPAPAQPGAGWIWPLLEPSNLEETARRLVMDCRRATARALGLESMSWSQTQATDMLDAWLREPADASTWRKRWFLLLARSLGLACDESQDPAQAVIRFLDEHGAQSVVVIDGLEERFTDISEDTHKQVALRALLQDVPNQLRELPSSPLGILVFVRADIARAAIPQNFAQFQSLYDAYALRWDAVQALRLVVWVCRAAGVLVALEPGKDVEKLTASEASLALEPVWGVNLGRKGSNEARTARWVIGALSDLKGRIQARDLVRLLRHAAEHASTVDDRLLGPRAIRDALAPCSKEKIEEIEKENPVLKPIFDKLSNAQTRHIPFVPEEHGLALREVELLEENGVVVRDEGKYYMPEIFRHGLGFGYAKGARPRVLSLAKRVLSGL